MKNFWCCVYVRQTRIKIKSINLLLVITFQNIVLLKKESISKTSLLKKWKEQYARNLKVLLMYSSAQLFNNTLHADFDIHKIPRSAKFLQSYIE